MISNEHCVIFSSVPVPRGDCLWTLTVFRTKEHTERRVLPGEIPVMAATRSTHHPCSALWWPLPIMGDASWCMRVWMHHTNFVNGREKPQATGYPWDGDRSQPLSQRGHCVTQVSTWSSRWQLSHRYIVLLFWPVSFRYCNN